jgi:hypothetical protein
LIGGIRSIAHGSAGGTQYESSVLQRSQPKAQLAPAFHGIREVPAATKR